MPQDRPATVDDVHAIAGAMPHVTTWKSANPIYQVSGKSFVFFRNPRPDAVDPESGERYDDVIVLWVPSEADKLTLVQDPTTPFFTTSHFNGHRSVLIRASRLAEITSGELAEIIQDAWVSQTSKRRAAAWLTSEGLA